MIGRDTIYNAFNTFEKNKITKNGTNEKQNEKIGRRMWKKFI